MTCLASADIKRAAQVLGFAACGVARAAAVSDEAVARYDRWLSLGHHGCMGWAEDNRAVRDDPRLLVEGARSIIMVAMNYYPGWLQPAAAPQVAYYAYGKDYHKVVKRRLKKIVTMIGEATGEQSRAFVDSAPLRERYWAVQAGLGFIGLNNQLIIPGRGSYFVLGAVVTTLDLEPDEPCRGQCQGCRACVDACPVQALSGDGAVDARRCLSCLTIEQRGPLPAWAASAIGNHLAGCDRCQQVCPHNRDALATTVDEFQPSEAVMGLTTQQILTMTQDEFDRLFAGSPLRRAGLDNLRRNAALLPPIH